jgi:hypothetical protein
MKKFLMVAASAMFLVLLSSATAFAQNNLGNRTNCPVEMHVEYGNPITCASMGSISVIVPPLSVVPLALPPGASIIASKGYYVGSTCGVYYVGEPCSGLPYVDNIACTFPCGNFTAQLFPTWGLVVYN